MGRQSADHIHVPQIRLQIDENKFCKHQNATVEIFLIELVVNVYLLIGTIGAVK